MELRKRKTKIRGDILICATKSPAIGFAGHVVCVATIVDCIPFLSDYGEFAYLLTNIREMEHLPYKGNLGFQKINLLDLKYPDLPLLSG